jgi:predicted Holliday junction resolvase-like endonuclease
MIETLFFVIILLVMMIFFIARSYFKLRVKLFEALSRKQSLSTKYGKMTEQFMPFMEKYPYDEHNFRFLGNPIDGVQFNEDGIVFVEFKAADSRLTTEQRRIKELVRDKRISFEEIRIPPAD